MIQFEYRTKVYYKDVDQMGIVYYARYYEYFEAARTELLKSLGIHVTVIENEGYLLPVVTSHCDYKVGAKFEDTLVVNTIIKDLPKSRLSLSNCTGIVVLQMTKHWLAELVKLMNAPLF